MSVAVRWQRMARRARVPLGFVFAAVFLAAAHPSALSLLYSVPAVAAGLLLRGYASGYVKKNAELTVTGPYAWTRNPLYLGSMLIAFGFAGAARSPWLALALVVLFAAIYIPVIRGEEAYLAAHFAGFEEYQRRVPRLVPWRIPRHETRRGAGFAPMLYRKHREYNAFIGAAALYLALVLRMLVVHGR